MDNTLEQRVLFLADEFIQILIDLYDAEPEKEEELTLKAEEIFFELAQEALKILQGKSEYLETMLKQLVAQKLPSDIIMDSFEGFEEKMQNLIKRSLDKFQEQHMESMQNDFEDINDETSDREIESCTDINGNDKPDEEKVEEEKFTEEDDIVYAEESCEKDSMEDLIKKMFPKEELIKDFKVDNVIFKYYLPRLGLAFFGSSKIRKGCINVIEMCCEKEGILLLKIDPQKVENFKRLKREINLILAQKNSADKRIFDLSKEYI